ncbi:hypothetical protein N7486_002103 [Penicillium sp. IBT 16267x]|nr:hypothetical protein N7486_002103 [Penicillium sp. IBT 16267x]
MPPFTTAERIRAVEVIINYEFHDKSLLVKALEAAGATMASQGNKRLALIGDAALRLVLYPDTPTSMGNLASTYRKQGRWEEAEQLDVQVMETRKTKLGEDHPDTLTSMANLASTYRKQGRWEKAERLFVQGMETSKTKLGEDHPDTLTSMAYLAFTWKSSAQDAKAIHLLRECLTKQKQKLSLNHPTTLSNSETLLEWETEATRETDAEWETD